MHHRGPEVELSVTATPTTVRGIERWRDSHPVKAAPTKARSKEVEEVKEECGKEKGEKAKQMHQGSRLSKTEKIKTSNLAGNLEARG